MYRMLCSAIHTVRGMQDVEGSAEVHDELRALYATQTQWLHQ